MAGLIANPGSSCQRQQLRPRRRRRARAAALFSGVAVIAVVAVVATAAATRRSSSHFAASSSVAGASASISLSVLGRVSVFRDYKTSRIGLKSFGRELLSSLSMFFSLAAFAAMLKPFPTFFRSPQFHLPRTTSLHKKTALSPASHQSQAHRRCWRVRRRHWLGAKGAFL